MKKLLFLFASVLLAGVTVSATTTTNSLDHNNAYANTFVRGYGDSFIFVEQGVEFAVFPDGQFDFNVDRYGPNLNAYADFGGVSISFNTGHSYDAYVQYDDYGAVIQIENVAIYYDYYGRIVRAGSVRINYNNYGRISRVGGLYVHYNRYNRYSHYTGYINVYNRHYTYRPWHTYYAAPIIDLCVVFNRPYRQYYKPVRHTYYRPYRDNYRPNVSYSSSRRGTVAQRTTKRSDRYRQSSVGRRGNDNVTRGRRVASVDQNRTSRQRSSDAARSRRTNSEPRATNRRAIGTRDKAVKRRTTSQSKPRTINRNDKARLRTSSKPRTVKRNDNARPRVTSKPRSSSKQRVTKRTNSKPRTQSVKQRNKSSKASPKRSSERIRHKSRATSNKKSNTRSQSRRRQ